MLKRMDAPESFEETVFAPGFVRPPLVSVIVTNYNYARFIEDCLSSIVAQTYPEIECFIVDDVSSDDSVVTIRRFIAETKGAESFQIVELEVNGGQMNAFIEGFQRAKGEFIVFVDADDYLFPDFIEIHVAAHLNPEFAAGLSCSNEILVDGENRLLTSSMEKWHRSAKADYRLSPGTPVLATKVEDWRNAWQMHSGMVLNQKLQPLLFIEPDGNINKVWLWSTTSGIVFRRGVLDVALTEDTRGIRICADYYLLHFCHLIGGTLIIQTAHGCYRRHGANNFALNATIGRGTRVGATQGNLTFDALNDLIESVFIDNYDKMVGLTGEPRMMQILAAIVPVSRIGRVLSRMGQGRPFIKFQFLAMFCVRFSKRLFRDVLRKLRFA